MKLNAVDWVVAVLQTHDFEGLAFVVNPCGDFEAWGDGFFGNDEAVIAGCDKRVWEMSENPGPVVTDAGSFTVHQTLSANDFGAVDIGEALMAETDAEHRDSRTEMLDDGRGRGLLRSENMARGK